MLKTLLITMAVSGVIISGAIAQSETPTAPPAKDQSAALKESTSASEAKFITLTRRRPVGVYKIQRKRRARSRQCTYRLRQ